MIFHPLSNILQTLDMTVVMFLNSEQKNEKL
jgi:hypothetical protein